MRIEDSHADSGRRSFLATISSALPAFIITAHTSLAQDKSGFPDGYDAVDAAPGSPKVIFENKVVRVLEVTVPLRGRLNRCITIAGQATSAGESPAGQLVK